MKSRILVVALCAAAPLVFARDEGGGKGEYFAKAKEIRLEGMRGRISLMQQSVSCVQSAQTQDAMRACEQSERSAMEDLNRRMKERWESNKPR